MKIFNKNEWKKVKLGDVCDILDSKRIPISEEKRIKGEYPYYGANGIQGYINDYIFDEELVLLAEDGGNFGSKTKPIAYKISGKTWVNNHAHVLKAKDEIISTDFLLYSLMFYDVTKLITGTTRKKLTRAGMEKITIYIPTLSIQNKITDYLNKIENFISFREHQLSFLKELNKSLFTKYSIGEKESIANLCYVKARIGWQGLTKKEYLSDGEYYLITGVDFKNEKIDFKNCFHITEQRYNQDENIKVKINDILLTKDGTIGKVAIVDKLEKPASLNSGVFVLRPKVNNLNVIYLMHSLISDDFKKFIDDIKIGATVPHLNQTALLKYKVILPPIELQNKFAERVEKIEKLKFEIEKSIEEAQKLYDSLIYKYFDN